MRLARSIVLVSVLVSSVSAAPSQGRLFFLVSITADGKHALLQELTQPVPLPKFRIVAVDTGAIEAEIDLRAIGKLPYQTHGDGTGTPRDIPLTDPGLADDLKLTAAFAKFPLGHSGRIAAGRDGRTAFNVGDWIYTARDGTIGPRVADDASYDPWITPDGKSIVFRRHTGLVGGIGRYELFVTAVDGRGIAQRIEGTTGARETYALDKTSLRVIVSSESSFKTCVVEIDLTKPARAKQRVCLSGNEQLRSCVLSPTGSWAACRTAKGSGIDKLHLRVMHVATGRVVFDEVRPEAPQAITDDGVLVCGFDGRLAILDAKTGKIRRVQGQAGITLAGFPRFRNATELVTERNGSVAIVDITKLTPVP